MLCNGKSPGANRLHPEVKRGACGGFLGTLHCHKRCLGKLESSCRLEGCLTSHHLQGDRQDCGN